MNPAARSRPTAPRWSPEQARGRRHRRAPALPALLLTVAAVAAPTVARAQPALERHLLYRGSGLAAGLLLDLSLQGQQASGFLLDDARARTYTLDGKVGGNGTITLTVNDAAGSALGSLTGARSSAPNDDGRTFRGRLRLPGTSAQLTLERIAQFVDIDVREGPIHVHLSYPNFAAGALASLDPELGPSAAARITTFVEQGRRAQAARQLFHSWEMIASTRVEGLAGPYVSLLTRTYAYTGGAHGNHAFAARTYRVEASGTMELGLAELFRPGADYLARLGPLVLAGLRAQKATWVVEGQVTHLSAQDLALFSLTPAGLAFTFPPYAMGPYVQGAFTVVVPYARVADLALAKGAIDAFLATAP